MAATNINRVILTGNLTRDPELRSTSGGMSVCSLRIASNTRRKDNTTGEWVDKPNYFSVTVWGAQGENCARFLSKGRPVCIDGRLEWREWQDQSGNDRYTTEVVLQRFRGELVLLDSREGASGGRGAFNEEFDEFGGSGSSAPQRTPESSTSVRSPPTASAIAGSASIEAIAPSTWRPPWLETITPPAPRSRASAATSSTASGAWDRCRASSAPC